MEVFMKFEEALLELEGTVKKLENGNVSLDEAISLFEKGIKLSDTCRKMLDKAEKKVSVLVSDESGELKKEKFSDLEE